MTPTEAIESSVQQDRIVTIEPEQEGYTEVTEELQLLCDDSTRNGPVTEYWGTDDEGEAWRVHVLAAGCNHAA